MKRSSPLHVSKQKQWRTLAAPTKADAIKRGLHERGRRYGRFVKALAGMTKVKALPSNLFLNMAANAGLITKAEAA